MICDECLDRAKGDSTSQFESKTHKLLKHFLHSLNSDEVDTTSDRNSELVSLIMHRLATLQSSVIDSEIQAEIRSPKTHETLKGNCCENKFLRHENRSVALLRTLMGFGKLGIDAGYDSLPIEKLYSLCTAYEAILSLKHSKVTTAPAVMRNLIIYKTTHNRQLLEAVGAPSGGRHSFLEGIMNASLPSLNPPINDFVNCDDNLQVKRVISSSKLKEGFKHTVKVVDSHICLQNKDDVHNSVLKNEANQPKNWLRDPTVSDVEVFELKIEEYQIEARRVRSTLLNRWLEDESKDLQMGVDPVTKLTRLRRSRPDDLHIFPCVKCGGEGRYLSITSVTSWRLE